MAEGTQEAILAVVMVASREVTTVGVAIQAAAAGAAMVTVVLSAWEEVCLVARLEVSWVGTAKAAESMADIKVARWVAEMAERQE